MSLLWLRLAVILYGLAALAVLPAALYNRPRWRHIAMPAALAGVFFHFVSLAETLAADKRELSLSLPIATHETLSMLGLILAAAFLLLATRYKTVSFGIFLLPIAALLTLVPAFRPGHETIAYPFIRTGWLLTHVALLLLFGLPCMTAGLLIGSVVALETIGPSFFADPKVLLSIAMWVAYMLMIFIRRHSGLRGRRAVYLSSFVFLVVLAVWSANQLSAVHRFTTP
jgi:ABC-type uncharacterized transport system permease subunit